jgi:hypothetical protein
MFRQITRRGDLSGLTTRPSCFIPMPLNRYFTSNPDSNSPMTGIRANHNFDQQKLFQYLSANGIDGFNNSTLCTVKQFSHGQSNPTFMIIGDNGKKFTVRKQPPGLPCPHYLLLTCLGNLLPGAHAVDREYAVMTALRNTNVPIPTTRLFCNDKDIIGSPFFVYGTLIPSSSSFSLFTSDVRFCGGTVL